MGSASFPLITKFSSKMFSNPTTSYTSCLNLKTNHKNLPQKPSISHFMLLPRYRGLLPMALGANNLAAGEEDKRSLETVLKLYTALRNRNIAELSDVIGEECRCVSNFISIFQPFHGKKQVLDFFSTLMKCLGNNIQFVVHPTLHDGMNVGVTWRLEWNQNHVPLGKGFSFYMCHIYQGKVMIRSVEMFMEPVLHLEPFRLKVMGFVMTIMDKIGFIKVETRRVIYVLLVLSLMTALFLFV